MSQQWGVLALYHVTMIFQNFQSQTCANIWCRAQNKVLTTAMQTAGLIWLLPCSCLFGMRSKTCQVLFPLNPILDIFSKKQDIYYYAIYYICTKRWIFTFLWKTEWTIETINSNCLRLKGIFTRTLGLNKSLESTKYKCSWVYFTEKNLVNLNLRTFRCEKNE